MGAICNAKLRDSESRPSLGVHERLRSNDDIYECGVETMPKSMASLSGR